MRIRPQNILLVLLFLLPLRVSAALFDATEFTLNNGLRCVVVQNHKAPLIKQMIWYGVGSADEKLGEGGSAHLLEHLMFRGTQKVKDGEFNRIMTENGVYFNAFTNRDVTVYHEFADVSRLEVMMALEADRMRNLQFDEKAFETERKIVFQERKQTVENNPASIFYEKMRKDLFGDSAYGRPITGENEEIRFLTYDGVRRFYDLYYAPNNALLILVGDIDAATAKDLAEKYYGKIPGRYVERKSPELSNGYFRQNILMKLPRIETPKVVADYLLFNHTALKGKIYDYLLLAMYLGGGETSELYRDLVVEQKIALGVGADFEFLTRGNGIFQITLVPSADFVEDEIFSLLQSAIRKAMENLDDNKLEKVKRKMLADLVFANDNPEDAADFIGYMMSNGFSLAEVQEYESGVTAVKTEDVLAAYREVFQESSVVKGVLLPNGEQEND